MNKKLFLLLSPILFLLLPVATLAAPPAPDAWLVGIIDRLLNMVVWPVFSGLVVVMLLYAGIKYLFAHGDATKIHEANKALVWAVAGVFVGLVAFSLVGLIRFALGL